MIDYRAVIARHRIVPKGVIHVGGYHGTENVHYIDMGFTSRIFIEASPATFEVLKQNLEGTGTYCENFAISDQNGTVDFHAVDHDMSSSLLPLKGHSTIYPWIKETHTTKVQAMRLDDLLLREPYRQMEFNFMNVDVQGAEMLVLGGAIQALKKMDFLNLEVNFDELYEGAPHVRDLDHFLAALGFTRADTIMVHGTWGDAIWVRDHLTIAHSP